MKISGPVLLGIAFVVLKLCNVIDWPWLLVTCPFWAGLAILLACLIVLVVIAICSAIISAVAK